MNQAALIPCDILKQPSDEKYEESIRQFQGCPTVAITPKGKIFAGWYSGGTCEPHMENYNLLIYSDDSGKSWSKPILIIPSSKEKLIHALDIQLWTDPSGAFHVFWVQNNVTPPSEEMVPHGENQPAIQVDGYNFCDFEHSEWEIICRNPDEADMIFSEPRRLDKGFLRCKPLILKNGNQINFNYDQMSSRYGYSMSEDGGKTFSRYYGSEKIKTFFDEAMAYETNDGTIRMLARTSVGELAESSSDDGGKTWSPTMLSGIDSPDTRFFISRTPTGRVLLINNDDRNSRTNMTVYLSEDDGVTWKYKRLIDSRESLSYPDADFYNGKIYMIYDRERCGAKEILFLQFCEDDIISGTNVLEPILISKPRMKTVGECHA